MINSVLPAQKGLRAIVAARISVLTDATTSPDSQNERGLAEAARREMVVVGEATDLDVSATTVSPWERPSLGWWLRRPDEFDAIIFRSIDRLARSLPDLVSLLTWAEKYNIHLICLEFDIDFLSPVGQLIAMVLGWCAQQEARNIATRVKGARQYMNMLGATEGHEYSRWPAGRPSYGYVLVPHPSSNGFARWPDTDVQVVVDEVINRVFAGDSGLEICRSFNQREVLSPEAHLQQRTEENRKKMIEQGLPAPQRRKSKRERRHKWYPRSLFMILRSHSLRNVVLENGQVLRDDEGMPLRYGPPLVDDATFFRLQEMLDERSKPKSRHSGSAPLVAILLCENCKERLYRNGSTGSERPGHETKVLMYRCVSRYRGLTDCPGTSVHAEEAEEFVARKYLDQVGDLPLVLVKESPGISHDAEIKEVRESMGELEKDRYDRGLYKGEEGSRRYAGIYGKLEKRLDGLLSLPVEEPGVQYIETGITYGDDWRAANPDMRRKRLLELNVRVYVTGRPKDGTPVDDRMRYTSNAFTKEELADRMHDEIQPDWA